MGIPLIKDFKRFGWKNYSNMVLLIYKDG